MRLSTYLVFIAIAAPIGACTPAPQETVAEAATVIVGDRPDSIVVQRNDDNTYSITDGSLPAPIIVGNYRQGPLGTDSYQTNAACDEGGICVYISRVYHGQTPGGEGEVTYVFSPPAIYNGLDFTATELIRTGPTTIPASGSIIMTGVTAVYSIYADGAYGYDAEGIAELTANFDDMEISGRTYDLQYFSGGGSLDQYAVTFELTDIADGSFSGVVNPDNPAYLNGTYDGLIVGASGDQAIGAYSFQNLSASETVDGIFMVGGSSSP